jgi:predicted Fe-Mo cluster-binding NifX family protein
MKVCIPTTDDRRLLSPLSPHFGRAPFLTIVDLVTGDVESVRNAQHHSGHGHCGLATRVREHGAEVVICAGLGQGALTSLTRAGVRVYLTGEKHSGEAIGAFAAGRVEEASSALVCSDGHSGSSCGHGSHG